ncbi:MAG: UDP-N-acetylmuramoyl-L-alanyl-D-glutamate--2,6-diaminopimelate ligase [Fidelibacterota bacterium]
MELKQLTSGFYANADDLPEIEITGLNTRADSVTPGEVFIAIKGTQADGHDYIPTAIKRGAAAIISNGRDMGQLSVPQIKVNNPRLAASRIAAEFYSFPSKELTIVGITGTNGKTTVASLVKAIFDAAGLQSAQMGTLGIIANGYPVEKTLTTLDPIQLQKTLRQLRADGFTHVVMEVSSHALDQYRVADVDFNAAVFTNLTPEHLDYHKSMEAYFASKVRLFKQLPITATAIINTDGEFGERILSECTTPTIITSVEGDADVHYSDLNTSLGGIRGQIQAGEQLIDISSSLAGYFNVENILSSVAAALSVGIPLSAIELGISCCKQIPGRMEVFELPSGGKVIIDYAHTPDAYEKVLSTIAEMKPPKGRLTVLFGCGGDRDAAKRPVMAGIAEHYSDRCYITPDNPRFEDPEKITAEIISGFTGNNYHVFQDRGLALEKALQECRGRDILVVLGKGREDYQDIQGKKIPYSEYDLIRRYCHAD